MSTEPAVTASLTPFSQSLPVELVREIFDWVAFSCPSSAISLCLLNQTTHKWIHPQIYRTVRLTPNSKKDALLGVFDCGLIQQPRKSTPIANISQWGVHVRNLTVLHYTTTEVIEILKACPNIIHLALWCISSDPAPLLTALRESTPNGLSFPNLRKIALDPVYLLQSHPSSSSSSSSSAPSPVPFHTFPMIFANITHIMISNAQDSADFDSEWELWQNIPEGLPSLTHLAMYAPVSDGLMGKFLDVCTNIEAIAVIWDDLCRYRHAPAISNSQNETVGAGIENWWKVVVVPSFGGSVLDSLMQTQGGRKSFWEVVDASVSKQRLSAENSIVAT